ncbi:MAG: ribosome-associated translation inhibitor RaiA [Bacillota bacterium]
MHIAVRGKNVEVTDALKEYVEKKVGKIEKYFNSPLSAQVTLGIERGRHIVEVTVPVDSMLLRGEEDATDMYASVDLVVEKIERQIRKYKTRLNRKLRYTMAREPAGVQPELEEEETRIVKVKKVPVKPMSPEEAVMQMNLIGHDFYVFANGETGDVNVVYKRKDGNYGLIEPNH